MKILCISILLLCVLSPVTQAKDKPSKTGWLRIQLPALPDGAAEPALLERKLDAKAEVFEIYIPPDYDPSGSYGVFAWVNPDDSERIPRQFESLLSEYRFVAVSAARIGNDQPWQRRVSVLESAILQLSQSLNLDATKRIMSGYSGGGRTSAIACFVHPDFWKGAISWVGGNFYKAYSLPMPVGARARGINDYNPGTVTNEQVKKSRQNTSFVLITGPKDFNLNDSRGIYRALKGENFKALLLEEPGLGHEVGNTETMRKALDFVLQQ
jgi:predicted esterase